MILNYITAVLVILGMLSAWVTIQHLARTYAARHPELGPPREEGGGCLFCLCKEGGTCPRRKEDPHHGTSGHQH